LAKHTLDSEAGDYEFALLGITCAEDQYRVVSLVNDYLGISMRLSSYVPMTLKKGQVYSFSLYRHEDENVGLEYFLLPNSSNFEPPGSRTSGGDLFAGQDVDESTRLIRELPTTDYFLMLKGELREAYKYKVLTILREVEDFTQVQTIEPETLHSKRNLIF
jgi:hypothetical protein